MGDFHITHVSPRGWAWLAALEGGHRLEAYQDRKNGVWTIGAGLTRWPGGRRVQPGDTISNVEGAMQLFQLALEPFMRDVDILTRDDVEQHEFDALVALCYNIGPTGLKTSTVLHRINNKTAASEIAEAWGWWNKDEGHTVPGLITRRNREIEVYQGGEYRDQAGIVIYP